MASGERGKCGFPGPEFVRGRKLANNLKKESERGIRAQQEEHAALREAQGCGARPLAKRRPPVKRRRKKDPPFAMNKDAKGGPPVEKQIPAALRMTAKKNRHPPPLERFFAALRMTAKSRETDPPGSTG